MPYNFVTNISGCIESATQLMMGNLDLVYYSHIPVAIIAFLIGFFVIIKNRRDLSAKVMFFLCMIFALWVICSLISWISSNSISVSFFWSLFGIINSLLFFSCLYLVYVYKNDKDMPLWLKIFLLILILPVIFMTPTNFNVGDFDYTDCYPVDNLFLGYMVYLECITILIMIFVAIRRYFTEEKQKKHEIILISIATIVFLLSIFGTAYISDSLQRYDIEVYGIFTMPLFLGFFAYLIVKFKAFDIKLLGTQALVWSLIILIGSQLIIAQTLVAQILAGVTLVISAIIGFNIVRSVKKEIALREKLEIANQNQEALIHFISHQIKGFLTKSKMIFSSIIEGDFGEASPAILDLVKTGLASDNDAVATVQNILGASNLKEGTTNFNFKKVDLAEMIKKIAASFTEEVKEKGLKLETNISDGVFTVMADETQISQVIKNLIDNSIKYTPTGKIDVSLRIDPKNAYQIIFEVKDTGIGLSESDKARLFTEGGKGVEAIKTNTNSTGYGLYIVKKIVESHHGKIWAESAGRGHGSQFFVELDLVK